MIRFKLCLFAMLAAAATGLASNLFKNGDLEADNYVEFQVYEDSVMDVSIVKEADGNKCAKFVPLTYNNSGGKFINT